MKRLLVNDTMNTLGYIPTLRDMLRAAEVLDNGPRIEGFKIRAALEKAIRRAVDVVKSQADAILADAGLDIK